MPDRSKSAPLEQRARIARGFLTFLLTCVAVWLARDFLTPLAWAVVIAVAVWPVYLQFTSLLPIRQSALAPLLFTILLTAILLVPILLVINRLAQESGIVLQWVNQFRENGIPVPGWLREVPIAGEQAAHWWESNLSNPTTAATWLGSVDLAKVAA